MVEPTQYLNDEEEQIDEATTGSAWMFYNHYNPDLLDGLQKVLSGSRVVSVVDNLLEVNKLAIGAGVAAVGAGLGYLRGTGRGPRKHKAMRKSAENWRQGSKSFRDKAKTETDPKKKEKWLEHSRSAKTAHKHMKAKAKAYKKSKIARYNESMGPLGRSLMQGGKAKPLGAKHRLLRWAREAGKNKTWKKIKRGARQIGAASAQAMDPQKKY